MTGEVRRPSSSDAREEASRAVQEFKEKERAIRDHISGLSSRRDVLERELRDRIRLINVARASGEWDAAPSPEEAEDTRRQLEALDREIAALWASLARAKEELPRDDCRIS